MNVTRSPDAIIAAWLEEGPSQLPDSTRRAIVTGTRTTHQARDRHGRLARRIDMLRFQSIAAVAAVAIVAVVAVVTLAILYRPGGDVGALPPTSAPTPTPMATLSPVSTAGWITFVSDRHGYSIRHPEDWAVTPASEPWPYGTGVAGGPGNPAALDTFRSEASTSRIVITSQLMPDGLPEADWIEEYRARFTEVYPALCMPPPEQWEHRTVDGVALGVYVGCSYVEAVAFAGGRAYTFTIEEHGRASRQIYEQMLETIVFDPDAAGSASTSFASEQHGYIIQRPIDWIVTPATEGWPYGTGVAGGPGNSAALDIFTPSAGGAAPSSALLNCCPTVSPKRTG